MITFLLILVIFAIVLAMLNHQDKVQLEKELMESRDYIQKLHREIITLKQTIADQKSLLTKETKPARKTIFKSKPVFQRKKSQADP